MYNFEDILQRRNNGSKKWNEEYIEKRFKVKDAANYYPLFIADMDFKLPKEVIEPLMEFIALGDFGYFDIKEEFYNSILKWYKDRYKSEIKREWIVPSIGALSTMNVMVDKLFKKGDSILVFTPAYGPFKDVVLNNRMNLVSYKMKLNNNKYTLDFKEVKALVEKEDIKGLIICNPHNPSGRCWSKEEINEIINICMEKNIIIISDEVHGDLDLGNNFNTFSDYLNQYKNIIVLSSPNKTFNIAGLEISTFLCNNEEMRNSLEEELSKRKLHPNRVGTRALTLCYENGSLWVDELIKNIKENLDLTLDMLNVDGISTMAPDAGYLLWVKFDNISDIDDFIIKLAQEKKVLLETGSRFIKDHEGYLRINVATSKAILKEAIPMVVEFYKEYIK